mmetsp:Transcript_7060/g.8114  ORF Transcript_7060/g.8114 Transcript_7060/m.8114 type:complete len:255 (-) Transcript_7060:267-1031(-)
MVIGFGDTPRNTAVCPHKLQLRELVHYLLNLPEVLPGSVLLKHLSGVVVHNNGHILLRAELVHGLQTRVVGSGGLLILEHGSKVIVTAHNLSNRPPHTRILIPHTLHVLDGKFVSGVERGKARGKTLTNVVRAGKPCICHHLVSVVVDVAVGVIILVVQRRRRLLLFPLLTARHTEHNGLGHIGFVHGFGHGEGSLRLLQEVHQVKVAIDRLPGFAISVSGLESCVVLGQLGPVTGNQLVVDVLTLHGESQPGA